MKTRSNRKFLFSLVAGLLSLLMLGVGPTHSADYPPVPGSTLPEAPVAPVTPAEIASAVKADPQAAQAAVAEAAVTAEVATALAELSSNPANAVA